MVGLKPLHLGDAIEPSTSDVYNKVTGNDIGEVIDYGVGDTFTREEERRVLGKIDLAVLPMVQPLSQRHRQQTYH